MCKTTLKPLTVLNLKIAAENANMERDSIEYDFSKGRIKSDQRKEDLQILRDRVQETMTFILLQD